MLSSLKYILKVLGPNKSKAQLLFIIIVLSAFFEVLGLTLLIPLIEIIVNNESGNNVSYGYTLQSFSNIFNSYVEEDSQLIVISMLLILIFLLKNIFLYIKDIFTESFIYTLVKYWTENLLSVYLNSSYSFLVGQKKGTMLNNAISEPQVSAKFIGKLCQYFSKIVLSISIFVTLVLVNWKVTMSLSVFASILFYSYIRISANATKNIGGKRLALMQKITKSGEQSFAGIKHLKMLNLHKIVLEDLSEKLWTLKKIIIKLSIYKFLPKPLGEMGILILLVLFFIYIQYYTNTSLSGYLPMLTFMIIAIHKLHLNLSEIISQRLWIMSLLPSIKLIGGLLEKDNLNTRSKINSSKLAFKTEINFKDVSFAHEKGNNILNNINLSIKKNSITAIVGVSGSGKSTIIDLLCNFYPNYQGCITFDDKEIREIDKTVWRENISYVNQEDFLLDVSIRDNILIANPNATDKELMYALKLAETTSFIEALPFGLDDMLNEGGSNLSAGQRQRLMIARAFIRQTEILIFDEATSFLDVEVSSYIFNTLEKMKNSRTIVIVSHRLQALKNANVIYFIEDGKVKESGTYNELVAKKGEFFNVLSKEFHTN